MIATSKYPSVLSLGALSLSALLLTACESSPQLGKEHAAGGCNPLSSQMGAIMQQIGPAFTDATSSSLLGEMEAELATLATHDFSSDCPDDLTNVGEQYDTMLNTFESATGSMYARVITDKAAARSILEKIDYALYYPVAEAHWHSPCMPEEWDRYSDPMPPDLSGCSIFGITNRVGSFSYAADIDDAATIPGVSAVSFPAWERSMDDDGHTLRPTQDYFDAAHLNLHPLTDIDYMKANSSTVQFSTTLDIQSVQPLIQQSQSVVVVYGRDNATAYHYEATDPIAKPSAGDVLLDYNIAPIRDAVSTLICPAQLFVGQPSIEAGSRHAQKDPWDAALASDPGLWAVYLACPGTATSMGARSVRPPPYRRRE